VQCGESHRCVLVGAFHLLHRCDIIEDVRLTNDLAMKAAPRKTGEVGPGICWALVSASESAVDQIKVLLGN
jgi:hypothetical protein